MSRVTPGAPLHRLLAVEDGGGVEQGRGGHRHGGDPDSRHQHRRGLHSSRVTCHVSGMVDTCHLDGEVRGAGPRDGEVSLEGDGGHGEDRRHDGEVSHEGGGAAEQRPEHPVPAIINVSTKMGCLSGKIFNDGWFFKDFFQPNHLLSILVMQMSGPITIGRQCLHRIYCVPKISLPPSLHQDQEPVTRDASTRLGCLLSN